MRKYIFTTLFLFLVLNVSGQSRVDRLVKKGIKLHDNQQYTEAIETYKQALEVEPKSTRANCEMAMTYMYAEDYKNSIKCCDLIIEQNEEYLLQAYTTKGSCLDYLGESYEAIATYKKALGLFNDNYLLNYNLGFTYYNINKYKEADEYFTAALELKPDHTTSHFLLGMSNYKQNQRVKSLLSLYYFLFLEPNTSRSTLALNLINEQKTGNVSKTPNEPNNINIEISSNTIDDEYGAADMMLAMLEASRNLDENKEKSEEEIFLEETKSFFSVLGELKKENSKGLWWNTYVPFFYELSKTEHLETFCYYIRISESDEATDWFTNNKSRIKSFNSWLSE